MAKTKQPKHATFGKQKLCLTLYLGGTKLPPKKKKKTSFDLH